MQIIMKFLIAGPGDPDTNDKYPSICIWIDKNVAIKWKNRKFKFRSVRGWKVEIILVTVNCNVSAAYKLN